MIPKFNQFGLPLGVGSQNMGKKEDVVAAHVSVPKSHGQPLWMWTAVIVLESGHGITVKLQYKWCTSSRGK